MIEKSELELAARRLTEVMKMTSRNCKVMTGKFTIRRDAEKTYRKQLERETTLYLFPYAGQPWSAVPMINEDEVPINLGKRPRPDSSSLECRVVFARRGLVVASGSGKRTGGWLAFFSRDMVCRA